MVQDYYLLDGKPLGEKNPKWLQDDYVKFLRFAQWKIEQAGCGVVGMITNHGYLDNPTFRGMRQSLMQTFHEIYVLDLHGNALKKEKCPDGSPDKNVFDIRPGVAIAFFIKLVGKTKRDAVVRHADLWGTRETKYAWLDEHELADTQWQVLQPKSPFYLFIPRESALEASYGQFFSVNRLFPANSVGVVTSRDTFVIDFDRGALKRRIRQFSDPQMHDEVVKKAFALDDKTNWKLTNSRAQVRRDETWDEKFVECLYRPFDVRWLFYHPAVIERSREEVMRHMLAGENLALITNRQVAVGGMKHAWVTDKLTDLHVLETAHASAYIHPLFIYPSKERADLFAHHEPSERQPNLNPQVVEALAAAYGSAPSPEQIFHYVYAVLFAPKYRQKYVEFLRMDFPRIPFTPDPKLFMVLCCLGERLVALHLLRSPELDQPGIRFEGEGDARVGKGKAQGFGYIAENQHLCINKSKYFAPVPPEVWAYEVGCYQVCDKWLKDRQDRTLRMEDIKTYCRIVTALLRTIEIQKDLDKLYPSLEIKTIPLPKESKHL